MKVCRNVLALQEKCINSEKLEIVLILREDNDMFCYQLMYFLLVLCSVVVGSVVTFSISMREIAGSSACQSEMKVSWNTMGRVHRSSKQMITMAPQNGDKRPQNKIKKNK